MTELHTSNPIEFKGPWRQVASAPPGGTVIGLADGGEGRPWLASPAGLLRPSSQGWTPVVEGLPFNEVNAIFSVSRSLFVAGLPARIAYTTDGGRRWFASRSDQAQQPVTCFTASPNFNRDGVVLAGTQGDGILRSTDGGRYWNLSNFGLRHFEVFALLSTPEWADREQFYAATDGGVYESPNGGRAWRPLGEVLQGRTVLCLARLDQPGQPSRAGGVLFAGTEQAELFRSVDGGQTWQQLNLGPDPGPVNSLCISPEGILLAGTSASGILRSADGGQSWQPVGPQGATALSLAAVEDRLYAGLHEAGLLTSTDDGQSWQAESGLPARRFNLLAAAPDGGWLAGGPTAGLWRLLPGTATWQAQVDWPEERPLFALAACGAEILAASLDGVWQGRLDGPGWHQTLQAESGINILAASAERAWAGHVTGGLWRTDDAGQSWQALPPAFEGQALVALAVSAQYETDRTLLAASAFPPRQELNFWRSQDDGQTWSAWFKEHTRWYGLQIAPAGGRAADTSFGFGLTVLTQSPDGLRRAEITSPEAPLAALLAVPNSPARIAAAGQAVLAALDGQDWTPLEDGLPQEAAVSALALSPKFPQAGGLFALTLTGDLWTRRI